MWSTFTAKWSNQLGNATDDDTREDHAEEGGAWPNLIKRAHAREQNSNPHASWTIHGAHGIQSEQ